MARMKAKLCASCLRTARFPNAVLALACIAWLTPFAKADPLAIKGYTIGMGNAEVAAQDSGWECRSDGRACTIIHATGSTYGGAPTLSYVAMFRDGKLTSIQVTFPSASYSKVIDALIQRYGPPSDTSGTEVQNAYGTKRDSRSTSWNRPDASLSAVEREGDAEIATVRLTQRGDPAAKRESEAAVKEHVGDL